MTKYGYCRISSPTQAKGQSLKTQADQLRSLGVKEGDVFEEIDSGSNNTRPTLIKLVEQMHEGDALYVVSLDRLSRNCRFVLMTFWGLEDRGIKLHVGNQTFDDLQGLLLLMLQAWAAEQQLYLIKDKTRTGISRAKELGKFTGRKSKFTPEARKELLDVRSKGLTVERCMSYFNTCKSTILRQTAKAKQEQLKKEKKVEENG